MDKDRVPDLQLSAAAATSISTRTTPKRHQKALSGYATVGGNSKAYPSPSSSPSDLSVGSHDRRGRGEVDAMESWNKDKSTERSSNKEEEDRGIQSNVVHESEPMEEDGYVVRSPPAATTTASLSSHKRVRLQGKVTENYSPVEPALVPRRRRSAIKKRSHQPASPPLSNSKKKRVAPDTIQLVLASGARKFTQTILIEPTEEEKEVAEALSALSAFIPSSQSVEEDKIISKVILHKKETSVSLLEASKKGDKKLLVQPSNAEAISFSSCAEERSQHSSKTDPSVREQSQHPSKADIKVREQSQHSSKAVPSVREQSQHPSKADISVREQSQHSSKAVPSVREQSITISGRRIIDLESNGTEQSVFDASLKSEHDHADNTYLIDAGKSSSQQGPCHQIYYANGTLPTVQLDAVPSCNSEINIFPLASQPEEQKQQSGKQKTDTNVLLMCQNDTTSDVRRDNIQELSLMPSSSKTVVQPSFGTDRCRSGLTGNGELADKLPPISAGKKWLSKRCTTHVYISHLIQNHQKTETKQQLPCLSDQSKVKEGKSPCVLSSNETNGSRNSLCQMLSVAAYEPEARTQMLQDRRLLQSQQSSMLSGIYSQQRPVYDFLSLSTAKESSSSGTGVKSSTQIHFPYLHPRMPQHSVCPYPYPPGPSPYPDQLASAANQQVQLQLPHYIANPFYGQHMVHPGGPTNQQQYQQNYQHQMWQAQMAHYRPLSSIPKWPGVLENENSSLLATAQPPSIFPPPSSEMLRGSYRLPIQMQYRQLLPVPLPSSSSRLKQQQPHDNSRLVPEVPSQLQHVTHSRCESLEG